MSHLCRSSKCQHSPPELRTVHAPINNDIALLQVRDEGINEVVNGFTSFDEEDDLSWSLELLA